MTEHPITASRPSALAQTAWRWSEHAQKIIILGAGGHARVCIETLRHMATFEIAGLATNDREIGDEVLGVPVLARDTEFPELFSRGFRFAVNGIGSVEQHIRRWQFFLGLKNAGFFLPNLVHPRATVEPSASLGEGNQILAGANVGSGVRIASNCIVNSGAAVLHDSVLCDNVHVAPGAMLAGGVVVGHDTLIGMGVKVLMGVRIGSGATICSGCIVKRNVADGEIVKCRE